MTAFGPSSPVISNTRLPWFLAWSDRWYAFRNRVLANRAFQHRAATFFLTRAVALRRARSLFDLVAGFVYSQVLLACVRLNLFETLSTAPMTPSVLADRLSLGEAAVSRLLAAASSLQLTQDYGQGRYGLGVLGATMVGNHALHALIEHHSVLYSDLSDPVALLRGEKAGAGLAEYWPYAAEISPKTLPESRVRDYSALMSASQPLVADEILESYPMHAHKSLLDIGGGDGTFLARVARHAPHLVVQLFDLPAVAEQAREKLEAAGLGSRSRVVGGDFLRDPLPEGADIATLVRVIHDHDDIRVLKLLKAAHRALAPGGTLLLAEPMAGTPGAEPMGDAYFGFYLLAMGRGMARTPAQLTDLLLRAGFERIRLLPSRLPLQTQILVARATVDQSGQI